MPLSEMKASYLEEVELSIVESAVIILIRYFKYTSKGFYAGWFHLYINNNNKKAQMTG